MILFLFNLIFATIPIIEIPLEHMNIEYQSASIYLYHIPPYIYTSLCSNTTTLVFFPEEEKRDQDVKDNIYSIKKKEKIHYSDRLMLYHSQLTPIDNNTHFTFSYSNEMKKINFHKYYYLNITKIFENMYLSCQFSKIGFKNGNFHYKLESHTISHFNEN